MNFSLGLEKRYRFFANKNDFSPGLEKKTQLHKWPDILLFLKHQLPYPESCWTLHKKREELSGKFPIPQFNHRHTGLPVNYEATHPKIYPTITVHHRFQHTRRRNLLQEEEQN